jgi:hypothetical protein
VQVVKKRRTLIGIGAAVVLALVAGALWLGPWRSGSDAPASRRPGIDEEDPATQAAVAFAAAWRRGTLEGAPVSASSGDVAGTTALITAGLTAAPEELPQVTVTEVTPDPGSEVAATATARVSWQLDGGRAWTYAVTMPLVREGTGDAARCSPVRC